MTGDDGTSVLRRADLVVLGGGPAGAISAWLAARDGLSVVLVDPERRTGRIEGMSPRLLRWLATSGIGTGGSVSGPLPRRADWAGMSGGANGEYVVARDRLDAHLRAAAGAAGAVCLAETGRPEEGGARLSAGARIAAPQVIDARGRAAPVAGRRRPDFATLSLCGAVAAADPPTAPGIAVSAFAGGWTWRVAMPGGGLWAQATGDARAPGPPSTRFLDALRATAPELGGVRLLGDVAAREAAPVLPAPIDDLSSLPVGDALSAMDPLSGHGLFWAVSSALAAAAAGRTLDARPGPATERLCCRYLAARARETYLRNARIGRDFLRLEDRFAACRFWAARRGFPDDLPSHDETAPARIAPGLALADGLVTEMPLLYPARSPAGIGWFGTVPAAELWAAYRAARSDADFVARHGAAARALLAELGP